MSPSEKPAALPWIHVLAIFLVALAVRLAYLHSVSTAPFFDNLVTNAERYDLWAHLILEGRAPQPPFEQAAGYAYFVALIYWLSGGAVAHAYVAQAVLDATTCALIVIIAARLFDRVTGTIAGLLAAVYGPLIVFCGELVPATLPVFLVVAATAGLCRNRGVLGGALWGIAAAVRSELLLAFPFALIAAARLGRANALAKTAIGLAGGLALTLLLNTGAGRSPAWLPQSGGLNLWLGNNEFADGVSPFVIPPLEATAAAVRDAAHRDPIVSDSLFRDQARTFMREHRAATAHLWLKKFAWTWNDRELPNTSDPQWQQSYSWLFAGHLTPLSFGMILPFALAGLPLLRRQRGAASLLLAPLVVAVVSCVVFLTNGRFRIIMVPSLLMLAALSLSRLPVWMRQPRRAVAGIALTVVGVALAWNNSWAIADYRIPEIDINSGALEREAGHLPAAIRYLRRGLDERAGDVIGDVHLALAYEQSGQDPEAFNTYMAGLAVNPHSPVLRERAESFFKRHHLDVAKIERFADSPDESERESILNELIEGLE